MSGAPSEYAIIAPMRALLIATSGSPALARLAPALATIAAQGVAIEAPSSLRDELQREGVSCIAHDEAALEAATRSLTAADLLIAPLGAGSLATPSALAAVVRHLGGGGEAPTILVDPASAGDLIGAISLGRGAIAASTRSAYLRGAAFAVAAELAALLRSGERFPERDMLLLERVRSFAHGENPHQAAAAYRLISGGGDGLLGARVVQGGEPTLNDLLDLDAGVRLVADLPTPSVALLRHTDPIGVASAETPLGAFRRALECDRVATSGAAVAINAPIDRAVAVELAAGSYESVVAPSIADESAAAALAARSDLRVVLHSAASDDSLDIASLSGAIVMQERDRGAIERSELRVVTERRPTLDELTDLLFSWRVVRHVRSNAIVVSRGVATLGIGAAQANRRVAVDIALAGAGERARGAVLASDAYFPFAEGLAAAAAAGITAVVQPGGSRRDQAAIEIADRNGMAMVFTGRRHYRR